MKRNSDLWKSDGAGILTIDNRKKRMLQLKAFFVVLMLDYFFYRSLIAMIPLAYIGYKYFQSEELLLKQKQKEELKEQFKEMLLLVSKAQQAGYSVDNAFLACLPEMQELYGNGSGICKMLHIIRFTKENRKSLPEAWHKIGDITQIAEIQEFAGVYEISQEKSGNMSGAMERAAEMLAAKMETEKEITVLLSAKRLEQRIMNLMPFLIMLYMMITSPGYFNGLYHTFLGVLIMSVCLGIYLVAYKASLKIVDIRL